MQFNRSIFKQELSKVLQTALPLTFWLSNAFRLKQGLRIRVLKAPDPILALKPQAWIQTFQADKKKH